MRAKKYKFRCIAVDETENWFFTEEQEHILHGVPAFGVYLYREGEATYCCSLSPSTWCEFLHNVFLTDSEEQDEATEDLVFLNGHENNHYRNYIRDHKKPYISTNCYEIVLERKEYASLEEMSEAAWEAAREYFQGNWPDIRVLMQSADEYHRKQRETARAINLPVWELPLFQQGMQA